ncbi:MAG TPA: hypothetical protein VKU90_16420 [Caulobacteraceae bacterium]|nr:hypothetical protein [Caulobacteraceae bacterium]
MFDAMVDEIIEVLVEFGGSAHRDAVIDRMAVRRGANVASELLRRDALTAFELNLEGRDGRKALVRLPFGEGSHRWGLVADPWDIANPPEQKVVSVGIVEIRAAAAA